MLTIPNKSLPTPHIKPVACRWVFLFLLGHAPVPTQNTKKHEALFQATPSISISHLRLDSQFTSTSSQSSNSSLSNSTAFSSRLEEGEGEEFISLSANWCILDDELKETTIIDYRIRRKTPRLSRREAKHAYGIPYGMERVPKRSRNASIQNELRDSFSSEENPKINSFVLDFYIPPSLSLRPPPSPCREVAITKYGVATGTILKALKNTEDVAFKTLMEVKLKTISFLLILFCQRNVAKHPVSHTFRSFSNRIRSYYCL